MKDFSNLKSQFLLDPEIIFFNHGSFGATPLSVFKIYQEWQHRLEQQPVEFLGRNYHDLINEARQSLSDYLGTKPENIVFVPNATTGINIAARSLSLKKGDVVLSTDHEYGAMDRTWHYLSKAHGFTYQNSSITLPIQSSSSFVDELFSHVNSNTRVIFLSHITSPTSLIFPIKEVCRKAHELGLLTVIDGAHAPGQIPLALDDLDADIYTGNCHKWLCAPKGSAFLYVRPELQPKMDPLIVSWGYESETPGESTFQDFFEWTGTRDISAYLSVPAAIQFQAKNEWPEVRQYCHELASQTLSWFASRFQIPSLYSSALDYAQMVTIPLPDKVPGDELKKRLYGQYHIEIPVIEWSGRLFIRLSIQAYNTEEEVDFLKKAIDEIYT